MKSVISIGIVFFCVLLGCTNGGYIERIGTLLSRSTSDILESSDKKSDHQTKLYNYYNHYPEKLIGYGQPDTNSHKICEIEYKAGLLLRGRLISDDENDFLIIKGYKGRMVEAIVDEKLCYVFSGFLLEFPVPDHHIEFINSLGILDTVRWEIVDELGDESDVFIKELKLDKGVRFYEELRYEAGQYSIQIDNFSFQEGFLLYQTLVKATAFKHGRLFEQYIGADIPQKSFTKSVDNPEALQSIITVKMDENNELQSISIYTEDGARNHTEIKRIGNKIIISEKSEV